MEWERAKTFLIIMLVLLNAGLFAMGFYVGQNYKMSPEDVSAIQDALSGSGITLACDIPLENKPVRLLSLSAPEWDYEYVKATFFPNEQVTRTIEEGNVIYRSENEAREVTVTNAQRETAVSELIYIEETAGKNAAEEYIELLGQQFRSFELCREVDDGYGGRAYFFNDKVDGHWVFASSVEVFFLGGSATLRVRKFDFTSYVEGTHEISRADEALLTFMHFKNKDADRSVIIESMQFGYGEEAVSREKTLKAKPYYRITISGESEPIYIDAIMNTLREGTRGL